MRKRIKRTWTILLAVVMLVCAVPVAGFVGLEIIPKAQAYNVNDTIQYGTYPQTRVTDSMTLEKLNAQSKNWKSYGYYTGAGNWPDWPDDKMQPGNYMQFADFFVGKEKYRAVTFSAYRPCYTGYTSGASNTCQGNNGYTPNNVYYFKYEPLTWRVLDPDTGYIMCENVIDAQAYQNTIYYANSASWQSIGSSVYANDYATSSIRDWLNYDFYETAFTAGQKKNIKTTALNNDAYSTSYSQYNSAATNDIIFLLSYADVFNPAYGFSFSSSTNDTARQAKGTDYAKCQGLYVYSGGSYNGNSLWWLRSPGYNSSYACRVNYDGYPYSHGSVDYTSSGIRPACRLSELKDDTEILRYLFSADEYAEDNNIYNLGEETYRFENFSDSDALGHCFGMSMTSGAYYNGILDMQIIGDGYKEGRPLHFYDRASCYQPICFYQLRQGSFSNRAIVAGGSEYLTDTASIDSDWNAVLAYVKDHSFDNRGTLQVGFRGTYRNKQDEIKSGAHAVNFLRYEVVDGQERIYIYDNNFPKKETYFYMDENGAVQQAPLATFSVSVTSIALRSIPAYFSIVDEFDPNRIIYANAFTIGVEAVTPYYMESDMVNNQRVMFELPDNTTEVKITPLVDNASFTYMDETYSFGKIDDDTYGVLKLSENNEDQGALEIKNAPDETPEPQTTPTNPTQPTTQQQPQQSGNCKYCGGTHTGFPGVLVGFFHSILALFGLKK